jgi:hypothetical protein
MPSYSKRRRCPSIRLGDIDASGDESDGMADLRPRVRDPQEKNEREREN